MIGVVLAGGEGTRLRPLTYVANKHLLPVYNKPMIYYPIETLKEMGCDEIVLVSGGNNIGGFAELLQDGHDLGVGVTYRVQPEAGGIAQALGCVQGLVSGVFPVILGDNFFSSSPKMPGQPTLFTKSVPDPERFGIYQGGRIIEKPVRPKSDQAVVGLYVYDERAFDIIAKLRPSSRGELEITDLNNAYLKLGATVQEITGYWRDMGTFNSLMEVANYVGA